MDLHPETEPHASGTLPVGDGHSLFWETVGDPDGTPAVYLHGGLGGGSTPGARRFFDRRAGAGRCSLVPVGGRARLADARGPALPALRRPRLRAALRAAGHALFLARPLPDGALLAGTPSLAGIPAVLVHGRHDVSGPVATAWAVHRAWPGSELVVLEGAGHGGDGFGQAVTAALHRFRDAP